MVSNVLTSFPSRFIVETISEDSLTRPGLKRMDSGYSTTANPESGDEENHSNFSHRRNYDSISSPRNDEKKLSLRDLEFVSTLGVGGYGKVHLVRQKSDHTKSYALKVIKKSKALKLSNIIWERKALIESRKCPFIVDLIDHYSTLTEDYFLMEFLGGGELHTYLNRVGFLSEPKAKFYLCEIVSALNYLHGLKIIYRDLKPSNIIMDYQGHIKLTDFGLCKKLGENEEQTWTLCGTVAYMSPEFFSKSPNSSNGYGKGCDIWALGVITYEMLTGRTPFRGNRKNETIMNILDINYDWPKSVHVSKTVRDFVDHCLKYEDKRIQDVSKHDYFIDVNFDKVWRKEAGNPPFDPLLQSSLDTSHFIPNLPKISKAAQREKNQILSSDILNVFEPNFRKQKEYAIFKDF